MIEEALDHSEHQISRTLFGKLEAMRNALRRRAAITQPATARDGATGEDYYPFDLTLANCRMPAIARRILESYDFSEVAEKRRANFSRYSRLLSTSNQLRVLFPNLPDGTCPWVFPVLLERRNEIDHRWRAAGVALHTFGIYLHSELFKTADTATIADAVYLSEHLLCLAIHQDISVAQVERSAATINQYLETPAVKA
jgi:dTDP-4-amino-4,6-dideoxygalactose transaminase